MNKRIIPLTPLSIAKSTHEAAKEMRQNTTFTRSYILNDPEVILGEKYGDRFREYRISYKRSL